MFGRFVLTFAWLLRSWPSIILTLHDLSVYMVDISVLMHTSKIYPPRKDETSPIYFCVCFDASNLHQNRTLLLRLVPFLFLRWKIYFSYPRSSHQQQKYADHNPDSNWHTNNFSSLACWLDPLELLLWPLLDALDISPIAPLCIVKSSLALLFLLRNIRLSCCLEVFLYVDFVSADEKCLSRPYRISFVWLLTVWHLRKKADMIETLVTASLHYWWENLKHAFTSDVICLFV